jgi:zinc transport system ATP-binding protein
VEARAVTCRYGPDAVVDGVDLRVGAGEFIALVGPNGSGKSTLARALLGLRPCEGTVRLFGRAPATARRDGLVAFVPQRSHLAPVVPATVAEVVATGRLGSRRWWRRFNPADSAAVAHALEAVALADLAQRPVAELSGGQQQRVLIARALVGDPALLVLDEPVAGVDATSQRRFRDALVHLTERHGTAVLLISHELSAVAADLDRVVVLRHRVVFDGPPARLTERGVHLGVHPEDLPAWLEGLGG